MEDSAEMHRILHKQYLLYFNETLYNRKIISASEYRKMMEAILVKFAKD